MAEEDRQSLVESRLDFNIHALIGGKFAGDKEHKLFLVYPQGNWVEVTESRPYYIIGETGYGRPVLDRSLKHGDSIAWAFKVGLPGLRFHPYLRRGRGLSPGRGHLPGRGVQGA